MTDIARLSDATKLTTQNFDSSMAFANQTTNEDVALYLKTRNAGHVYDSAAQLPGGLPKLELAAATSPNLPMDGALSPLKDVPFKVFTSPDGKTQIPVFFPTPSKAG